MENWINKSVFYHIYPLGCLGAPQKNDFSAPVTPRLKELERWLPHLQDMQVNAVYLGPVFESSAHGYDTADYFRVDRRLGENQTLKELVSLFHKNGIHVILDGVFNHVGRDFFAFKDLQQQGKNSQYLDWFSGIDFNRQSSSGDAFAYHGWNNHYDLVKLNLQNRAVCDYLFSAADLWMNEFGIDGLRIDAADCIDLSFLQQLSSRCKAYRSDFWMMGEIIHGNYAHWVNCGALDSVTNYECYKGLYSSHVDHNYFEIAYSLNRQFGEQGIYRHFLPYSFVDNHDVNRLLSNLTNPAHVYPVYCLLFCIPGIPSIYYGSEWGITGKRTESDDHMLRPQLDPQHMLCNPDVSGLPETIAKLADIRRHSSALQTGSYRQVLVSDEQFAFLRENEQESILTAVNSSQQAIALDIPSPVIHSSAVDLLTGETFEYQDGKLLIPNLLPNSGRIIRIQ
jgi:cyclomaltodextrinase